MTNCTLFIKLGHSWDFYKFAKMPIIIIIVIIIMIIM